MFWKLKTTSDFYKLQSCFLIFLQAFHTQRVSQTFELTIASRNFLSKYVHSELFLSMNFMDFHQPTSASSCQRFVVSFFSPFFPLLFFSIDFFGVVGSYVGIILFFYTTSLTFIYHFQENKAHILMWMTDVIQTCIRVVWHWRNRLKNGFCSPVPEDLHHCCLLPF